MIKKLIKKIYKKITPQSVREQISLVTNRKNSTRIWSIKDYNFYLAETGYNQDENKVEIEFTHKIHSKLHARGIKDTLPRSFWERAIAKDTDWTKDDTRYSDLLEQTSTAVDLRGLLHTYNILLGIGSFQAACRVRKLLKEAAVRYKHEPSGNFSDTDPFIRIKAAAELEDGDYSQFSEHFPYRKFSSDQQYFLNSFARDIYCSNLEKNSIDDSAKTLARQRDYHSQLFQIAVRASDATDRDYRSSIRGRTVAVVGPAELNEYHGAEIDSFDIVVRCNQTTQSDLSASERRGVRCDISYLSHAHAENYIASKPEVQRDLKWICFKNSYHKEKHREAIRHEKAIYSTRSIKRIDPLMLVGSANFIPSIISDLIFYEPKTLKIFFADMMLSPSRPRAYHDFAASQLKNLVFTHHEELRKNILSFRLASSVGHDPASQFVLMNRLKKMASVELTDTLSTALDTDLEAFLLKLEMVYGRSKN